MQPEPGKMCFLWKLFSPQQKAYTKDPYTGCNFKLLFKFVIFLFHLLCFQLPIPRFCSEMNVLPEVCLGRDAVAEPRPLRSCGEPLLSSFAAVSLTKTTRKSLSPLRFHGRKEERIITKDHIPWRLLMK